MIRSLIRTSATFASAALAFLLIAPIVVPSAIGRTLSFPDTCSLVDNGGGNFTMSCQAAPPGALSCSIIGAPGGPIAPSTPFFLTANCSGGTPPYRYSWSPGGGTNQILGPNIVTTTAFSVLVTDAANNISTPSVTVTVTNGPPPPPPPPSSGFCGQYSNVLPVLNATWGTQGFWPSATSGNFGDNAVWVFKLVVPPGTLNSTTNGRFTTAEYQGPNTPRELTISTQACDFRTKDYTGANGPLAVSHGSTAEISYGVAAPFIFGPAGLTPGQTYYINVRNWQLDPTPQWSCGLTSCNALMNDIPATP